MISLENEIQLLNDELFIDELTKTYNKNGFIIIFRWKYQF